MTWFSVSTKSGPGYLSLLISPPSGIWSLDMLCANSVLGPCPLMRETDAGTPGVAAFLTCTSSLQGRSHTVLCPEFGEPTLPGAFWQKSFHEPGLVTGTVVLISDHNWNSRFGLGKDCLRKTWLPKPYSYYHGSGNTAQIR